MNLVMVSCLLLAAAHGLQDGVRIERDVVYGHKDGMAMTLDVFRPADGANGAGVLFMVSGGWVSRWADPERALGRYRPLLEAGFTVFAVRHGSSPKYLIPEIVADVRRAVRFVKLRAAEFGVDPERLGVWGGSAGGHLSLMLATAPDPGDPGAEDPVLRTGNRVAAVVAYFPPVDLRGLATDGSDGGRTSERFPALNFPASEAPEFSPILHVSADDPPTLLVHGNDDRLVPVSHSRRMHEALQEAGVESELIILAGAGHGFRGQDAARATAAMVRWFVEHLSQ